MALNELNLRLYAYLEQEFLKEHRVPARYMEAASESTMRRLETDAYEIPLGLTGDYAYAKLPTTTWFGRLIRFIIWMDIEKGVPFWDDHSKRWFDFTNTPNPRSYPAPLQEFQVFARKNREVQWLRSFAYYLGMADGPDLKLGDFVSVHSPYDTALALAEVLMPRSFGHICRRVPADGIANWLASIAVQTLKNMRKCGATTKACEGVFVPWNEHNIRQFGAVTQSLEPDLEYLFLCHDNSLPQLKLLLSLLYRFFNGCDTLEFVEMPETAVVFAPNMAGYHATERLLMNEPPYKIERKSNHSFLVVLEDPTVQQLRRIQHLKQRVAMAETGELFEEDRNYYKSEEHP